MSKPKPKKRKIKRKDCYSLYPDEANKWCSFCLTHYKNRYCDHKKCHNLIKGMEEYNNENS